MICNVFRILFLVNSGAVWVEVSLFRSSAIHLEQICYKHMWQKAHRRRQKNEYDSVCFRVSCSLVTHSIVPLAYEIELLNQVHVNISSTKE